MRKFKVGDKVRVVDGGSFDGCTGQVFMVEVIEWHDIYCVSLSDESDEWSVPFAENELELVS